MSQFKRVVSIFLLAVLSNLPPASGGSTEDAEILGAIRSIASGSADSRGIRPFLAPSLLENPRLAMPGLTDTEFVRRLNWYAPFARSPVDRAAAAIGLWIDDNAETITADPDSFSADKQLQLAWPGARLFLEKTPDGLRIAGAADVRAIGTWGVGAADPADVRAIGTWGVGAADPAETAPQALPTPPPIAGYRRMTILLTNDIHGSLLPYAASWSKAETRPMLGAMASVAAYVRRSRAVAAALAEPLFLFDAGDIYQGTPEGTLTKGSAMIPVMNALRYDAIAVGNHEYDHGRENAERIFAGLRTPVLGANVIDTSTGELEEGLHRSLVLERGGIRLALTGLLTPHMPTLTFEKNIRNLEFRPQVETLMDILPELRAANCDLAILISHTGFQEDKSLADSIAGIDLILGGHSHTPVDTAWVGANRTVVVQTPGKASNIGRIDLLVGPDGGVDTFVWQLVPLYAISFPEDRAMRGIIQDATRGVADEMARVIGRGETDIPYAYRQESPMGRLTTDILREWSGADIAILAGGGMRAGFIPGPLAVRDCFQVFPFGNPLAVADVRGDVVSRVLEHGVSTERGRIQVSGVAVLADTALAPGRRLIDVRVADVPLDPARNYRIVTDGFLAQGGSGYFAGEKIAWEIYTDQTPFELLRDHVEKVRVVRPPMGERVRYRQ